MLKKKSFTKGNMSQFINALESRIEHLGGDVEACDKVSAAATKERKKDSSDDFVQKLELVCEGLEDLTNIELTDHNTVIFTYGTKADDVEDRWQELQSQFVGENYTLTAIDLYPTHFEVLVEDEDYYKKLEDAVCDLLVNEYHVDVEAEVETFGIRFEVYVPGTYDLLTEYVVLKEDCIPNKDDIDSDADTLAAHIIQQASENNEDADDEEDYIDEEAI